MSDQTGTVDGYIASFPAEVQPVLRSVREAIHRAAPGVEESISYQMPAFRLGGRYLVYFGGWKRHVGLYPVPPLTGPLEDEVAPYRGTKATLRFPLDDPVPVDLVERIVAALVAHRDA